MTHDELAEDLAIAKGGVPFLNACLGSVWVDGKTPRADLVVCKPSYTKFLLSVYEVKVSRGDFLSDIRSGKWRLYLPHCHRFYFAVEDGICTLEDIPGEAGLIIRKKASWYAAKAAPRLTGDIPHETLLSLIFARQRRSAREKRLDDLLMIKSRGFNSYDYGGRLKTARLFGDDISKLLCSVRDVGGIDSARNILDVESSRQKEEMLKRWKEGDACKS